MNYAKITKNQAEKLFVERKPFAMAPCKINPDNVWGMTARIDKEYIECRIKEVQDVRGVKDNNAREAFELLAIAYAYYNCNKETGELVTFYTYE